MSSVLSAQWRRQVVIFAKEPFPGRVKTRLARRIGTVGAARWFRREALALTRRLAADRRWDTIIAVAPDEAGIKSRVWPSQAGRWPQGAGNLGDRMGRALRALPPGPVVIVGADIPGVDRSHVWSAFEALGRADAVIGPATDGGFWLVGLRRSPRRAPATLFDAVRWSSEHARADTLASLRGLSVAEVAPLSDVDEFEDLPARDRARWGI
ncbi:MAG: TIGR04282 family arsenosugar biosynthesis glycosyltransferase [Neomegalonema sp.]|nr:TIGR04282 family arsenosugar biosynthesis glycosyltransferase [Neomegalonema sp.]